ncbi:RagB/SusD family nutrient uptake outer membrane protein [Hymenobacter daeguensis]
MKALVRVLLAATLTTAATGCEKFLDINENPNQPTSVNPDAQLANALTVTAQNYSAGVQNGTSYNTYSSLATGFWTKSGVVSGFPEERTYNYSNAYYQALWNNTYDNLNDYNLIQQNGTANGYPYHAAIARIMKAYNFLLLVDEYGDIPYTNALKGAANTAPSYDKAADIYKDLVVQLKGAVADINAAAAIPGVRAVTTEDVVFSGNMTNWKRFANSLRLRILLRESSTNDGALNSYVATEMTALQTEAATTAGGGFITADVTVKPGYASNSNQQNPFYNRYGYSVGLAATTAEYSYIMPTNYIINQYQLNSDPRIGELYTYGKRTVNGAPVTNIYVGSDLGDTSPPRFVATDATVGSRLKLPTTAAATYTYTPTGSTTPVTVVINPAYPSGGTFLRSASQPTVLMLLSEHLFSKSEAEVRGLFTGGDAAAKTDFLAGIRASFNYTFNSTAAGQAPYDAYIAANAANGLVTWEVGTTTVREGTDLTAPATTPLTTPRTVSKTDKILYQKYLAENTVASTEAWADYRRTAQPKFKLSLERGSNPLPSRLIYPQTEVSTNQANIPGGTNQFSKLFWDVID